MPPGARGRSKHLRSKRNPIQASATARPHPASSRRGLGGGSAVVAAAQAGTQGSNSDIFAAIPWMVITP